MEIRKMRPSDVEAAAAIEWDTFSDPWTEQGFLDALKLQNTCYLVAESNGQIQGYCGFYQSFEEANIVNVAVAAAYRKQKIGTTLLKRLLEEGVQRGVTDFILEVRKTNLPAVSLYESLGFQIEGIRKGFYEKPKEDAYLMRKCSVDGSGSISH